MSDAASTSDLATDSDILELYVGMTYSEALRRNADRRDWEGVLLTTGAVLGTLENVPFAGVALKAISRILAIYDSIKRHKRNMKSLVIKLRDLKGYLERLHGKLPDDEGLLKRTAEVVLGGMVVVHAVNRPFDGPRPLFR